MHKFDVITQTWGGALIGGGLVTAGPGITVYTSRGCPRLRHRPTSWRISVSWSSPAGTPSGASWLVVLGWSSYRAACSLPVASAGTSLGQYLPPAFSSLPPINKKWNVMVQGTSYQRNNSYIQSYLNNELSSFFLFYEIVKN